MSSSREDTMRQFCDVTGTDETRSRFFLESANWQLDVALSSFYEHGGHIDEAPAQPQAAPVVATLSDSDMDSPPGSPLRVKKEKKKTSSKFATLDSLHQDSSSDEEEVCRKNCKMERLFCSQQSDCLVVRKVKTYDKETQTEDETGNMSEVEQLRNEVERLRSEISKLNSRAASTSDTGQAFYAGGSERSGQQILGPGKGRKDIVTEMFKSVRERGAVVFEDEPSTASRGRGQVFSGVGYRLGQTSDDHEQVTPPTAQQTQASAEARSVRLRLYREGFTVDGGPLRHYTDPENAEFLSCIRRGEIPSELSGGGEVRVSLEDRRHEECPRTAGRNQPFSGKGHLLGSPTPPTVGATAPVAADVNDRAANQRAAQAAVKVDDTQPVTTIQFRLADGSRITGRFNHSHTVQDLQEYVSRAEPSYQLVPFSLLTSFPSSELSDPRATLLQANLLNSTLLQRLK